MPEIGLTIGGDPSGALGAISSVKAALAGLTGKSITVDIKTNMSGVAGGLDGIAKASDRAAGSARDHANAADRAAAAARGHGDASDRAAASARDLADAVERGSKALDSQAQSSERAATASKGHAAWAAEVAQWMSNIGNSADRSNRSLDQHASALGRVSDASRSVAANADAFGQIDSGSTHAADGVRSLGGEVDRAGRFMVDAGGSAERVSSGMAPIESSATRAAAGMRALTAGTNTASDAGKDWTDGWTGRASTAEQAAQSFRVLGGSAAGAGGSLRSAGSELAKVADSGSAVSKVFDASGGAFNFRSDMPNVWKSLASEVGNAASSFADLGSDITPGSRSLMGLGLAAGVGAIGMGALAAATAGIGAGSALLGIMKSPQLMHEAQQGMQGFGDAFKAVKSETTANGMPAMQGLATSVKGLGQAMATVGKDNVGAVLGNMAVLTGDATSAVQKLAPAVQPAIQGVTDLGGAVLGAFGDSAPAIAGFSETVSRNAGGIQDALHGTVGAANTMGTALVNMVGTAGPQMDVLGSGLSKLTEAQNSVVPAVQNATKGNSLLSTLASGTMNGLAAAMPLAFGWMSQVQQSGAQGSTGGFGSGEAKVPNLPGSSWHAGPGMAPIVGGQSNDMSGVVSDVYGGAGSARTAGGGGTRQAPPTTPGGAYGAVQGGTAGPEAAYTPPPGAPGGPPAATSAAGTAGPATGAISPSGQPIPQGPGSAGPSPVSPANVAALQQATTATQGLTAAQNQLAPATQGAAAAAGAAGTSLGSMGQSAQQAAGQAQGAAAQTAPAAAAMAQAAAPPPAAAAPPPPPPPPPAPPAPPPPPPPPAAPAAAAVAKTTASVVQASAPAAAAGGANIGSSMGTGMGVGVTKEITNTLTIVKKWIVKVVETAASALDAHSPSRVFASLGESIPTGLIVGMQAQAPAALSATQAMIKQVTAGAQSQLVSAQTPLAKAYQAALNPPAAATKPPPPPSPAPAALGGRYGAGTTAQQNSDAAKKSEAEKKADKQKAAELDRQQQFEANKAGLMSRGMSENSAEAKAKLEQIHTDKARALRDKKQSTQNAALLRARGETPSNTGDPAADSAADRARIGQVADKQLKHDRNKDAALKLLGVRPQTEAEKAAAPPPPGSSKAADLASKKAKSDANAIRAKGDLKSAGQDIGKSLSDGTKAGIDANAKGPADAAGHMAGGTIDAAKKKTKTKSPSQEFHDIGKSTAEGMVNGMNAGGLAGNIGAGISSTTSAIQGIASDSGLQVGYRYAQSMVSGINTVLKSDDFKAAAIPQIDSPQAKAALGAMNLLGPAGSGASVWKSSQVSVGAGSPATQPINLTVALDGTPFYNLVTDSQNNLVNAILNELKLQKN